MNTIPFFPTITHELADDLLREENYCRPTLLDGCHTAAVPFFS